MAENEITAPPTRSARFKRHIESEVGPTDMTLGRRAMFRPSEEIAVRRDVIDVFRQAAMRDVAGTIDDDDVKQRAMFSAALAEEAVGQFDKAAMQLSRLRRHGEFWGPHWQVTRRVHRQLGDYDEVAEALERAHVLGRGTEKALLGLERARFAWEHGNPPREVASWVRRVMAEFDSAGRKALHGMPVFTAACAVQLASDAALEAGQFDRAVQVLDSLGDHPGLSSYERQLVTATLALWSYAMGRSEIAVAYLRSVGEHAELPADFEEAFVHLLLDEGDREGALRVLQRSQAVLARSGPMAAVLAFLQSRAGDDAEASRLLRTAREAGDDPVILDACIEVLERTGERTELIDVINHRLEMESEAWRKAVLLARLGRLYEAEVDLEGAAADVYREALSLVPDYAPAIRALGRLYNRRHNWRALVDLYEHEIEALKGSPNVWRRHFQAAEIYEHDLEEIDAALGHYRKVLEQRPKYLPALKGAARLLDRAERWAELADMFLDCATNLDLSRRQRLYLLDRVAEVAEFKLGRLDVAIGAWEEVLHLHPEHPRAFSALGRLFARTGRWAELVALNDREIEQCDDDEEIASLLVRNAEISERELGRTDAAEAYYQQVLARIPDYLPALEGLGRIYARGGRWGEIVGMTGSQLRVTDDPREAKRQLGALAELFETQLERTADAITVFEKMLEVDPTDFHAYDNLLRLLLREARWQDAFELVSSRRPVGFEADLAWLAEWRLEKFDVALRWYLAALDISPDNAHWLEGVARTWRAAGADAGELADRLESLLMSEMSAAVRDRYFLVLARLREQDEQTPDAGRAYRAHGDSSNRENQIVLRLAMAVNGERAALTEARRHRPVFPWDTGANIPRVGIDAHAREAAERALAMMTSEERTFVVGESETAAGLALPMSGDEWAVLRADLQRVMRAEPAGEIPEAAGPELLRLRALEASTEYGDLETFRKYVLAEVEVSTSREIRLHRLIDLAEHSSGTERMDALESAIVTAYPQLDEESQTPLSDGPVYDRLFAALQDNQAWGLLRRALEAHVRLQEMSESRRLAMVNALGATCEEHDEDFAAARKAYQECWEISGDREYLRDLVRVCRKAQDDAAAVEFQTVHHEQTVSADVSADERAQSALWLAEVLRDHGRGEDAVACLESAREGAEDSVHAVPMTKELARLHVEYGNSRRAVELFQSVLTINADPDDADDWRLLIRVQREELDDPTAAYALLWQLIKALPTSVPDLDALVDLSLDLDEIEDCAEQLEVLASEHEGAAKIALLGRAAVALDEDLNRAEDAVRLYQQILELTAPESEEHRHYRRRCAFCLSRVAGRESEALAEFRTLARVEPFEPSTYRGMAELLGRVQAHDRARVAHQVLRALACETGEEDERPKTTPSRPFEPEHVETLLLPEGLRGGVLGALRAVTPLAERLWIDELPQRKALDGTRVKEGRVLDLFTNALAAFGIRKFRLLLGDAGPVGTQVFGDGSVWINEDLVRGATDPELRFIAGYCAAIVWSDLASLLVLDGRRVWHLLEGVQLKQAKRGFGELVDVSSQELGEEVGSPLHAVARRRVAQALEPCLQKVADAHCESWPLELEAFACRVGLVLCADAAGAASGLLRLRGWTDPLAHSASQDRLRHATHAADVLRYALSDEYLKARHAIGLAGRPSELAR